MNVFDEALKQAMTPEASRGTFIDLISGNAQSVLETIEPESVHLVVTDPPYFLDGLDDNWKKGTPKRTKSTAIGGLPVGMKFDPQQGRNLQSFMEGIGTGLFAALRPGGFALFFSQPRLVHRMAVGLEDVGFEIRDLFAWHYTKRSQFKASGVNHWIDQMNFNATEKREIKRSMKNLKTPQLRSQFQSILLAQKPKMGTHVENWLEHETGLIDVTQSLDGKKPSTLMTVEKPDKSKFNGHLTVKPLQLIEYLIRLFSAQGQVVLDPFLGSGTTAVACLNTERSCIGIEISDEYIGIAEQRLKEHGYDQT